MPWHDSLARTDWQHTHRVRKPLHFVLKFLQGSRPAAHLDIAGARSRSTSEFVVMARGVTDSLVFCFDSTCRFVASGISVI